MVSQNDSKIEDCFIFAGRIKSLAAWERRMKIYQKTIAAVVASVSLSGASVAAVAPVSSAAVNPYAVIGVYGSPASAQVACGNAATMAAAGAAAAIAQAPAPGCVLPVIDPAAAPLVEPSAVVVPAGGPGILPLLIGLAGVAGFAAYIASLDNDGEINVPRPLSPA